MNEIVPALPDDARAELAAALGRMRGQGGLIVRVSELLAGVLGSAAAQGLRRVRPSAAVQERVRVGDEAADVDRPGGGDPVAGAVVGAGDDPPVKLETASMWSCPLIVGSRDAALFFTQMSMRERPLPRNAPPVSTTRKSIARPYFASSS